MRVLTPDLSPNSALEGKCDQSLHVWSDGKRIIAGCGYGNGLVELLPEEFGKLSELLATTGKEGSWNDKWYCGLSFQAFHDLRMRLWRKKNKITEPLLRQRVSSSAPKVDPTQLLLQLGLIKPV